MAKINIDDELADIRAVQGTIRALSVTSTDQGGARLLYEQAAIGLIRRLDSIADRLIDKATPKKRGAPQGGGKGAKEGSRPKQKSAAKPRSKA